MASVVGLTTGATAGQTGADGSTHTLGRPKTVSGPAVIDRGSIMRGLGVGVRAGRGGGGGVDGAAGNAHERPAVPGRSTINGREGHEGSGADARRAPSADGPQSGEAAKDGRIAAALAAALVESGASSTSSSGHPASTQNVANASDVGGDGGDGGGGGGGGGDDDHHGGWGDDELGGGNRPGWLYPVFFFLGVAHGGVGYWWYCREVNPEREGERERADDARASEAKGVDVADTESIALAAVSIVVPALNEEACIESLLKQLSVLEPAPHEVIVSVGDSHDRTAELAAAAGAKVVTGGRGRGRQMNDGASAATGDVLVFLHADTSVPSDAVAIVSDTLRADDGVVLGGFVPIISVPSKTFWGMSLHNVLKTFYCPAILQPLGFIKGLKILFGDQAMFCRAADFGYVGGFDEHLPIMEDADLCLRMHQAGPSGDVLPAVGRGGASPAAEADAKAMIEMLEEIRAEEAAADAAGGSGADAAVRSARVADEDGAAVSNICEAVARGREGPPTLECTGKWELRDDDDDGDDDDASPAPTPVALETNQTSPLAGVFGGDIEEDVDDSAEAGAGGGEEDLAVLEIEDGVEDERETTRGGALFSAEEDNDEDEPDEVAASTAADEHAQRSRYRKGAVYPMGARRGKVVLVNRAVTTSGRRIEELGNFKATLVHFLIGLSWYAGASPDDMVELYRRFYADVR